MKRRFNQSTIAPELPIQTDQDLSGDSMFNYHLHKMTFGLLIMGFENAVKEGDEQCLFETSSIPNMLMKLCTTS